MILSERKSKYKHKITIPRKSWPSSGDAAGEHSMREWCGDSFGPGGRKMRWRFGWTDKDSTFFFKSSKDAMMFTLRWSN